MKFLLVLLLCSQAFASELKMENGEILPLSNTKYPLKQFIKDYARLMKINVTYPSDMLREKDALHIEFNTKTSPDELKKVFYEMLANLGYTTIEEKKVLWLHDSRDIRYLASEVYSDQSFPRDARYSTVLYKLKYPLSTEVSRNLRPIMTRFGRIIDLSDARTIILNDQGDNIERLIKTIQIMDTEGAYNAMLTYKAKPDENADNPLQEKVLELELQKKLLEEKLLKNMESVPSGMQPMPQGIKQ